MQVEYNNGDSEILFADSKQELLQAADMLEMEDVARIKMIKARDRREAFNKLVKERRKLKLHNR